MVLLVPRTIAIPAVVPPSSYFPFPLLPVQPIATVKKCTQGGMSGLPSGLECPAGLIRVKGLGEIQRLVKANHTK